MRTFGILVAAGLSALTFWACTVETNNPAGSGGAGGKDAASSSSSASSSSGLGSGTGGAKPVCDGVLDPGPCNDCAIANCCPEVDACLNDGSCWDCLSNGPGCDPNSTTLGDLQLCVQGSCAMECAPVEFPMGAANCDAPKEVPSKGACVTLGGNAQCNPVTNDGCNTAAGEACDFNNANEFVCFGPPNEAPLCGGCDNGNGPFCQNGMTCVEGKCARYCCDDADCGPGATCSGAYPANGGKVGACVGGNMGGSSSSSSGGSSSSGMGGAGGAGSSSSGSSSGSSSSGMGGAGGMGSSSSSTSGSSTSTGSSSSGM